MKSILQQIHFPLHLSNWDLKEVKFAFSSSKQQSGLLRFKEPKKKITILFGPKKKSISLLEIVNKEELVVECRHNLRWWPAEWNIKRAGHCKLTQFHFLLSRAEELQMDLQKEKDAHFLGLKKGIKSLTPNPNGNWRDANFLDWKKESSERYIV